jgi:choline dehydrogenase-like flavoprotein
MPMTAHCIGGCVMGTDPAHGVIDAQHRVFGYQGCTSSTARQSASTRA